jgi:hypothetical protein
MIQLRRFEQADFGDGYRTLCCMAILEHEWRARAEGREHERP